MGQHAKVKSHDEQRKEVAKQIEAIVPPHIVLHAVG